MERMVDKIAKTVDEAVKEALLELNVSREEVDIEVLEEPTKGLLGIGAKPALVRVIVKENKLEEAKEEIKVEKKEKVNEVLSSIVNCMGLNINSKIEEESDVIKVNIDVTK